MRPKRRSHALQSLDSNAALGNIDLGYTFHWWDGAVLPIGLGLSLVMNAIFFAKFINEMEVLTLADVYARKFGPAVEVIE
jgi:solute:Na+ symporter, SSS family